MCQSRNNLWNDDEWTLKKSLWKIYFKFYILKLSLKIINFHLYQWWGNGDWRKTDNQKTKSAKPQHYTFNCNEITDYTVQ